MHAHGVFAGMEQGAAPPSLPTPPLGACVEMGFLNKLKKKKIEN